jgi:hypothetical protein
MTVSVSLLLQALEDRGQGSERPLRRDLHDLICAAPRVAARKGCARADVRALEVEDDARAPRLLGENFHDAAPADRHLAGLLQLGDQRRQLFPFEADRSRECFDARGIELGVPKTRSGLQCRQQRRRLIQDRPPQRSGFRHNLFSRPYNQTSTSNVPVSSHSATF